MYIYIYNFGNRDQTDVVLSYRMHHIEPSVTLMQSNVLLIVTAKAIIHFSFLKFCRSSIRFSDGGWYSYQQCNE